jgi:hypothetical protein
MLPLAEVIGELGGGLVLREIQLGGGFFVVVAVVAVGFEEGGDLGGEGIGRFSANDRE